MIPDISYLILDYNPEGEQYAKDVLSQTIDIFYGWKSENLTCDVFLLDQGSTIDHKKWIFNYIVKSKHRNKQSYKLFCKNLQISGNWTNYVGRYNYLWNG